MLLGSDTICRPVLQPSITLANTHSQRHLGTSKGRYNLLQLQLTLGANCKVVKRLTVYSSPIEEAERGCAGGRVCLPLRPGAGRWAGRPEEDRRRLR